MKINMDGMVLTTESLEGPWAELMRVFSFWWKYLEAWFLLGCFCSLVEFTASLWHIRATPAKLWEENND